MRPAADDRDANITQLISDSASGLAAVMSGHARANHGDGIFIFWQQLALDVEHYRRVINLPEQFGILRVRLRYHTTTEFGDPFQFTAQINVLLPSGDRFRGFLANSSDLQKLLFGSFENGRGLAEMFEQLPNADRTHMLDHVQRYQSFSGVHVSGIAGLRRARKLKI